DDLHFDRALEQPGLEVGDDLGDETLHPPDVYAGGGASGEIGHAVVQDRALDIRLLGQVLERRQVRRVEEPGQITPHAFPKPSRREDPLFPRLLALLAVVVGQPVQQRWLQALLLRELRHGSTSRRSQARRSAELDQAHVHDRVFHFVRGEEALANPTRRAGPGLGPLRAPRQDETWVRRLLGARVARGNERHALPAVGERQRGGQPGYVAKVGWLLDLDLRETLERNPVVTSVQDRFQHRAQTRVRIGDPIARPSIDGSSGGWRLRERLLAQAPLFLEVSLSAQLEGTHEQRHPFGGFAEDQGGLPAGKYLAAEHLAPHHLAVRLAHRERRRVQLGAHLELGEGPLPLPHDDQQLKQKDPQLGIRRTLLDVRLQNGERLGQPARADVFVSGHFLICTRYEAAKGLVPCPVVRTGRCSSGCATWPSRTRHWSHPSSGACTASGPLRSE